MHSRVLIITEPDGLTPFDLIDRENEEDPDLDLSYSLGGRFNKYLKTPVGKGIWTSSYDAPVKSVDWKRTFTPTITKEYYDYCIACYEAAKGEISEAEAEAKKPEIAWTNIGFARNAINRGVSKETFALNCADEGGGVLYILSEKAGLEEVHYTIEDLDYFIDHLRRLVIYDEAQATILDWHQ